MELIAAWLIFSFMVAVFASNRGRWGIPAFFLSVILSPILMLLYYVAVGESKKGKMKRIREEERMRAQARQELAGRQ